MAKCSKPSAFVVLFFLLFASFQVGASGTITVSTGQLHDFRGVYPGNFSDVQFYYIEGQGLTQPLQILVEGQFKVSLGCHDGFATSLTINPTGGSVTSTRVFVRFFPETIGAKNGTLSHSSGGATVRSVTVSGSGIGSTIPFGYYSTATGFGSELKTQLHNIIKNHTMLTYASLWGHFEQTDATFGGQVWDMYSDIPCQEPPYVFNFGSPHQDTGSGGNIEGQHFNREHSIPRSWYGASESHPMHSDLFHVWPVDKWVNSQRGNLPYGQVNNPNWTSQNGGKRGPNILQGFSGTAFEPIDAYKGDIARGFLYVITRYENEISNWTHDANGMAMLDNQTFPGFKPWALNMLRQWHQNDPVSQKEILRNNAIYSYQGNRNPFIDHPEFVEMIWSPTASVNDFMFAEVDVFPNPATNWFVVSTTLPEFQLRVFSSCGRQVLEKVSAQSEVPISLSGIEPGVYFLIISSSNAIQRTRLVVL